MVSIIIQPHTVGDKTTVYFEWLMIMSNMNDMNDNLNIPDNTDNPNCADDTENEKDTDGKKASRTLSARKSVSSERLRAGRRKICLGNVVWVR